MNAWRNTLLATVLAAGSATAYETHWLEGVDTWELGLSVLPLEGSDAIMVITYRNGIFIPPRDHPQGLTMSRHVLPTEYGDIVVLLGTTTNILCPDNCPDTVSIESLPMALIADQLTIEVHEYMTGRIMLYLYEGF